MRYMRYVTEMSPPVASTHTRASAGTGINPRTRAQLQPDPYRPLPLYAQAMRQLLALPDRDAAFQLDQARRQLQRAGLDASSTQAALQGLHSTGALSWGLDLRELPAEDPESVLLPLRLFVSSTPAPPLTRPQPRGHAGRVRGSPGGSP